ncbi:MAG: hypothetical protein HKN76_13330, partial [Saprospiraceae bacterium]|nr:hypothetical protein [Saprospiraceae bacterium]
MLANQSILANMRWGKHWMIFYLGAIVLACNQWDFSRVEFTDVLTIGAIEVGSNVAFLLGDIEGLRNAGITESGFVLSSTVSAANQLRLNHPGVLSVISQDQDT